MRDHGYRGVYMVARMNFLYVHSAEAMTVVALIGACTALFAATIGCLQYDIKKVLAYSTVSQLAICSSASAWARSGRAATIC